MKKLIAVFLMLAVLLPVSVYADNNYVSQHYYLFIDGNSLGSMTTRGGRLFDFDSLTVDLYLCVDGTGYYMRTKSQDGVFLNSGITKIKTAEVGGKTYIVDDLGYNIMIERDEDSDDLWIYLDIGTCRMHPVNEFNQMTDIM